MVFTKTGVVNSDKSILYVEKIKEEFFDIYSFEYKDERVVVTGKKEGGTVHAKINVEGVGLVPVCIKKGKPALLLSENLARKYDSRIITESVVQKTQQPVPVVLVEQQKREILNHIDNELTKYKDRLDFFTENATQFVESKVKEHGASLLKEYLKTVDKLKPTFESLISENFRNHVTSIDGYVTNKINDLDNRIISHLNSNNEFKSDVISNIEESESRSKAIFEETVNRVNQKFVEIKENYNQFKTNLTDYVAAAKETSEELTNNTLKNIQEKVDLCLENAKKDSNEIVLSETKNAIEEIKNGISSIHEKNKKELFEFNQRNYDKSVGQINNLIKEEKQNLVEFHNQQVLSLNQLNEQREIELMNRLNDTSDLIRQERQVLFENYKQQIDSFSKIAKEARNEFKKMMSSLKEDIKKAVLESVNKELLEESNGAKATNVLMSEIRTIKARLDAQYIQLKRDIADVGGGGGGNVAVQYAAGGQINGSLNVVNGDYLSAGTNLADMYLRMDQIQNITEQQAQNFMETLQTGSLNLDTRGSMLSVLCATPASEWIINHNFGYIPKIMIIDSDGDEIDGNVMHNTSYTSLTVQFAWNGGPTPVAGIIYLD